MNHSDVLKNYVSPDEIFHPICCKWNPHPEKLTPCKVIDVYDGDTITVLFHLFNDERQPVIKEKCRLFGINTPEVRGEEKESGKNSRDELRRMICNECQNLIFVRFEPKRDKYGRLLGTIYARCDDSISINKKLVDKGLAKVYIC